MELERPRHNHPHAGQCQMDLVNGDSDKLMVIRRLTSVLVAQML